LGVPPVVVSLAGVPPPVLGEPLPLLGVPLPLGLVPVPLLGGLLPAPGESRSVELDPEALLPVEDDCDEEVSVLLLVLLVLLPVLLPPVEVSVPATTTVSIVLPRCDGSRTIWLRAQYSTRVPSDFMRAMRTFTFHNPL